MKRFEADLSEDQLKEKILDAADKRLRLFGFKKTTMAEIADDLGMSTANLYRYFPSKLDIADAFALRCFVDKEQMLLQVIKDSNSSAVNCLKEFALALLRYNFNQLSDYPAINEIVVELCAKRPSLVERKKKGELDLILNILRIKQDNNGWKFDDINQTGRAILASWLMFTTPAFMAHHTLSELEQLLVSVLDLTINGLNREK